jgi:hypothetical protein
MIGWPALQLEEDRMSDTIDLTLLSGRLQALECDLRQAGLTSVRREAAENTNR